MAIINAYSGNFPWRKQKQRHDAKEGYQYTVGVATMKSSRKNKSGRTSYTTGGWSVYTKDQYDKNPTKPEMVPMKLYNNTTSYVPVGDVETFLGHDKILPDFVPPEMAAQVEEAFSKPSGVGRYYVTEGVGHIKELRYSPSQQIMQVSFGGDSPATVTFFRIPNGLYSELAHLAASNSMSLGVDGKPRHTLGIRFWDEVRIRGQRTGGRYPYTYSSGGTITAGSKTAGSYGEMMGRQNAPQSEQPVDAQREATITNKEEAPPHEKEQIEREQTERKLSAAEAAKKIEKRQKERIMDFKDTILDRYGPRSKQYQEMTNAENSGWGAVMEVAKKYQLWSNASEE
jgi:hypothetical protein